MDCSGIELRNRIISIPGMLAWNFGVALLIPLIALVFTRAHFGWATLVDYFLPAFVYSNLISGLLFFLMPRMMPRLMRWPSRAKWLVLGVVKILVASVGTLAGVAILALLGTLPWSSYWAVFSVAVQISLLVTLTIGSASTAYHVVRFRLERANLALRTKELEEERALKLATAARLSSLESRVHPHFLFNALNSITSLIREDSVRAEELLIRMSALLRFSLDASQTGVVSLQEELKIVEDYLEIERARFGDRLRYSIRFDEQAAGLEVPPLSIQTLVENSVKYAVGPQRRGATIRVFTRCEDDRCAVIVEDDGPGFNPEALLPGHGLDTLQARLALQFPGKGGLEISRDESGAWTRVAVLLPAQQPVAV